MFRRSTGYIFPWDPCLRDHSPIMRVITMNYNPLDCTCWAYSPLEYCEYCNLVCDAALEDFECGLGDWFSGGQDGQSYALFMRPY
jgi:hypothetical protein